MSQVIKSPSCFWFTPKWITKRVDSLKSKSHLHKFGVDTTLKIMCLMCTNSKQN